MPLTEAQRKLKEIVNSKHALYIHDNSDDKNIVQTLVLCKVTGKNDRRMNLYIKGSYALLPSDIYEAELKDGIIEKSDDIIKAYYLPWKERGITQLRINNEADIVLTHTLSGCTFKATLEGESSTVYHGNYLKNETCDQERIDSELRTKIPTQTACFTLQKSDYWTKSQGIYTRATVVGLKEENQWNYYSSYYTVCFKPDDTYTTSVAKGKSSAPTRNNLCNLLFDFFRPRLPQNEPKNKSNESKVESKNQKHNLS